MGWKEETTVFSCLVTPALGRNRYCQTSYHCSATLEKNKCILPRDLLASQPFGADWYFPGFHPRRKHCCLEKTESMRMTLSAETKAGNLRLAHHPVNGVILRELCQRINSGIPSFPWLQVLGHLDRTLRPELPPLQGELVSPQ